MLLPLIAALAVAAPIKLAVSDMQAGLGVAPQLAQLCTTFVVSELRKNGSLAVTSQEDLQSLIGFHKQKQLLQCADTSCLAEIGGALGVEQIVTGSLSKLGESVVVVLRLVDVHRAKVLRDTDRRLKDPKPDAVLDALPQMLAELFPQAAASEPPKPVPAAATAAPAVERHAERPSSAPFWIAGVGGAVLLVGGGLLVGGLVEGQARTLNGVTSYGITAHQAATFNTLGAIGETAAGVGAAGVLGGLGWALFRPSAGSKAAGTP